MEHACSCGAHDRLYPDGEPPSRLRPVAVPFAWDEQDPGVFIGDHGISTSGFHDSRLSADAGSESAQYILCLGSARCGERILGVSVERAL